MKRDAVAGKGGGGDFEGHEKSIKERGDGAPLKERGALCMYTCMYTGVMRIRCECAAAARIHHTPDTIKCT